MKSKMWTIFPFLQLQWIHSYRREDIQGKGHSREADVRAWAPEPEIASAVFRSLAFIRGRVGAISLS